MQNRSCKPPQVLVVDDEAPSRKALNELVQQVRPDMLLNEAKDGTAALQIVQDRQIDIAFLDIDMPDYNGIDLAEAMLQLPEPPLIIFATASNEHAVKGFELNAVDYVVKPFRKERIEDALARAQGTLDDFARREHYAQSVQKLVDNAPERLQKLWAERSNGARLLVNFADIGWASAQDKEVFVRTAKENLRVRMSLNALTDILPADTFLRVHRSHLVNIHLAREVIPWDSHSMTLVMGDENRTEIPVSRKYVHLLKQLAGW